MAQPDLSEKAKKLLKTLVSKECGLEMSKLTDQENEASEELLNLGLARVDNPCWKWGKRLKPTKKAFEYLRLI